MSNTVILIAQVVTILTFVGMYVALYRLLVSQKDATIESLKQQIELMRADFESIAVEALGKRVSIMERELERMLEDNTELSQKVDVFEAEARKADEEFKDIRAMAREIMQMRHEELHHREKRRSRYYDEILENDDAESTPQDEET